MNRSFEEYYQELMENIANLSFDLSDFYEGLDESEIETYRIWEGRMEVLKVLNKVFIALAIVFGILDFLVLVTALSASARKKSASWYLYHLNFVTILQIIFVLPKLEDDLLSVFGVCMFFSFAHWTLTFVYSANLFIMNIEILASIIASNPRWKKSPKNRFGISMTAIWISCILLSVIVMFFGHEEKKPFPVCFHVNQVAEKIRLIFKDWVPAVLIFAQIIAGLVLFIRTKKSPENYSHIIENKKSLQSCNEWFACFMTWNLLVILTNGLAIEVFMMFSTQDIFIDIIIQMCVFLIGSSLPLCCLLLETVRETYVHWTMAVFQFLTGRKPPNNTENKRAHLGHESEKGNKADTTDIERKLSAELCMHDIV